MQLGYRELFPVKMYVGMIGLFLSYRFCFVAFYVKEFSWIDFTDILFRGWLFDNCLVCVLLLPLILVFLVSAFQKGRGLWMLKVGMAYCCTMLPLVCLVTFGNLFYYNSLFTCIDYTIWGWMCHWETVIGMMLQDGTLSWGMLLAGILCAGWVFGLLWIIRCSLSFKTYSLRKASMLYCFYFLFCIFGILGGGTLFSTKFLPLQIGDAYFSPNKIYGEAVHNPCYVLGRTTFDAYFRHGMPELDYAKLAQAVCIKADSNAAVSPPNVVLIIMEGMQASFVNDSLLAPFLYGLKKHSLYFPHAYSSGRRTAHAVFSTLTGLPAPVRHPFFGKMPQRYPSSLPALLRSKGYSTLFMMPHDGRFDNMKGFLYLNGFNEVLAMEDYPAERRVNVFGLSDDYFLCEEALPALRREARKSPFFCTLLTVSNHIPYVVPDYFSGKERSKKYRVVEYADWALSSFFQKARREEWFANTLFVLVGDHARENDGSVCRQVAAHHVAMYFYAPSFIRPEKNKGLAGQVDIVPTVMGYVGYDYTRCTYGVDLNREKRKLLLMTSDKGVECIDGRAYWGTAMSRNGRFEIYQPDTPLCIEERSDSTENLLQHYVRDALTGRDK